MTMPAMNGGKILLMNKYGLGSRSFCIKMSRPQAHPEDECGNDGISQRE